ncbi:DUF2157 domain-containing protein [Paenibacillus sp. YYML68]|uniref:DUF2157 domain-containing protein n=1 Tax=Paenibacillus sp. YYML68 TaxID=2909250 RepID=UPI0024925730|nr:DUF2157 domain-containing protein [Paenibacillus sp. YYML68]
MSRKWAEREAPIWVEKGIVTREQADAIVALYVGRGSMLGVLPLLGSVLVGLGILSFVAANWQEIPQLVRLLFIAAVMVGFYAGGESFVRSGQQKLGIALIGLGVISFGAGIILIGQMFHMVAYDATSFILWASAGAAAAYLYKSRYLYILSIALFNIAQWYSVSQFDGFSYVCFTVMVLALGLYAWRSSSTLLLLLFSLSVSLQSLMWALSAELKASWMLIPMMALYALGDWLPERRRSFALQASPLASVFLFNVVLVMTHDWTGVGIREDIVAEPFSYIGLLLFVLVVSLAGKYYRGSLPSAFEWVLLLPFMYVPQGMGLLYLLGLFVFSLGVLWRGYAEGWSFKVNFGTVLFVGTALVAYSKLTWNFMDKSLFFILGGMLLIGLSWFLNRRNKQVLSEVKGGSGDD